jgi:hypothetical protein
MCVCVCVYIYTDCQLTSTSRRSSDLSDCNARNHRTVGASGLTAGFPYSVGLKYVEIYWNHMKWCEVWLCCNHFPTCCMFLHEKDSTWVHENISESFRIHWSTILLLGSDSARPCSSSCWGYAPKAAQPAAVCAGTEIILSRISPGFSSCMLHISCYFQVVWDCGWRFPRQLRM